MGFLKSGNLIKVAALALASPSYAGDPALLKELASLYPELTPAQFSQKLAGAGSPFTFFRSFVPYYYVEIQQNPALVAPLSNLASFGGWCAGDPHIGNFGSERQVNGQVEFAINDVDDSGPCPLYADAARFFTSILMNNPAADLTAPVAAYLSGLEKVPHTNSPAVQTLLQSGVAQGAVSSGKELKALTSGVFPDGGSAVSAPDQANLQQALTLAYGKNAILLAAYQTAKDDGGSAGLLRYETLVQLGKKTKAKNQTVIEFKRQVTPGIFPLAFSVFPPTTARIAATLQFEQGPSVSPLFQVQTISGLDFLMRPKWKANQGVDLGSPNLAAIIIDEAYALGAFHRKSADSAANYAQSVAQTPVSAWVSSAQALSAAMQSAVRAAQ